MHRGKSEAVAKDSEVHPGCILGFCWRTDKLGHKSLTIRVAGILVVPQILVVWILGKHSPLLTKRVVFK